MNKTQIVCTLGPASWDVNVIREMILNGMNVVRINMSHADYENAQNNVNIVRELNKELNTDVKILVDNKGPEIRLGMFNEKTMFNPGDLVDFYCDARECSKNIISVDYTNLYKDVVVGSMIIVDDKQVTFEVLEIVDEVIKTKCVIGGVLNSRKTVNVPNVFLNFEFLSEKDINDAKFACEIDADYLALSFVRTKEDIKRVRTILNECNNTKLKLISKIEDAFAIKNIEDLINEGDGLMVARGDLAVNIPFYEVPFEQKRMIQLNKKANKFTITATEMMASMETNPFPTRAEVTDVYNAVMDGTDAVMLSGESANGAHPARVVSFMNKITSFADTKKMN